MSKFKFITVFIFDSNSWTSTLFKRFNNNRKMTNMFTVKFVNSDVLTNVACLFTC